MTLIGLHFNILEKIGAGSFGTVYRVEDTRTKENFAIKIFDKVPLEEIKEHLSPEMIYKIASLSHENLIRVYDYVTYNEHLCALLEYFEGESLKNFRLGYENRDEFLQIIVQTCYALQYLHENNLLHKDLKLENILYTRTDEGIKVKVCDFGFAKVVSRPTDKQDVATLPYLSPEALRNSNFSPQSDFYSLGIILYYLAVGAFPFSKDEIALMIEKKIPNIMPQFPSRVNPAVSRSIEELIFKLIEFNPILRFQTAKEIIQFINKTHRTSFPQSLKISPVENIRSKPLKIHEKSILTLNDYVEIAAHRNGQIVFVTGDYGIGKKSSMQFLKWYLIRQLADYSTFFYRCDESHQDPIFMLCKELITMQ
ncbi:MAG: serine/threonine-protein kinase, partial [Candidatus Cloacimonadia bacterium]